jgi:hypothetical protein
MGMDVYGKKPTAPAGKYFRNSVWSWRPLAGYIAMVAPEIAAECKYWQSNDGDGLGARSAKKLADILDEEIRSGRCAEVEAQYKADMEAAPDEPCDICGGTGLRAKVPNIGPGDEPCNGCNSKGTRRPSTTYYPFEVENVANFAKFARASGGFEIH